MPGALVRAHYHQVQHATQGRGGDDGQQHCQPVANGVTGVHLEQDEDRERRKDPWAKLATPVHLNRNTMPKPSSPQSVPCPIPPTMQPTNRLIWCSCFSIASGSQIEGGDLAPLAIRVHLQLGERGDSGVTAARIGQWWQGG